MWPSLMIVAGALVLFCTAAWLVSSARRSGPAGRHRTGSVSASHLVDTYFGKEKK